MAKPMDVEVVMEQAKASLTGPNPPRLFTADELLFLASAVQDLLENAEGASKKRLRAEVAARLKEVMDGDFCWRVVLRLLREHREMADEGVANVCQGFMVEPERVALLALYADWHPSWRSREEEKRFGGLLEMAEPWQASDLDPYLVWLRDRGEVSASHLVGKAQLLLQTEAAKQAIG